MVLKLLTNYAEIIFHVFFFSLPVQRACSAYQKKKTTMSKRKKAIIAHISDFLEQSTGGEMAGLKRVLQLGVLQVLNSGLSSYNI